MSAAPEAPEELVSVPVPRPVAWIVSKIGWPGLFVVLLIAQATGWIDVALLSLGLPPLLGERAPGEEAPRLSSPCTELLEAHRAQTAYERVVTAETLAILARIERGCHE